MQLAHRVVHHPLRHVEVFLRLGRVEAAAHLACLELVADAAEGLQECVVEVGGEPVPLPQRGGEFHRGISAGSHLLGELRRLRDHLPPQEDHPREGHQQHGGQTGQRLQQPPRRPP